MSRALLLLLLALLSACSGGDGESVDSFCARTAEANKAFAQTGSSPSENPQAIALFEDLATHAPAEIKGEMNTILRNLKGTATSDDETLSAASAKVATFVNEKCSAMTSSISK